ncbi:MAG: hypothetical protein ACK55X_08400 [Synechococcaceae cyanobacterium]
MTVPEQSRQLPAGLVLAAVGDPAELSGRLAVAVARLQVLGAWPQGSLAADLPPSVALAALGPGRNTLRPPAWVVALPADPGLTLPQGGCWAEALGAWRQPTALVLAASQLASGWPAAATALLRQQQVPLAGLIQLGGEWEPLLRRNDGLPWLGWLAESSPGLEVQEDERALLLALARRWAALDLV